MTIPLQRSGDTVRAKFSGTMTFHDHLAADDLIIRLEQALRDQPVAQVCFDLSDVEALDSHWLGTFVRALRHVRMAGAKLVMERPQPDVRRLFGVVELDRVLEIAG
jgi:anti-anti-sigma factor